MRKMRLFFLGALLVVGVGTMAQNHSAGSITPEMLQEIKKGYTHSDTDRALRNAITQNDITTLVANGENARQVDTYFSDRVVSKGVSNQYSSGRCWLFTGLNVFRAEMMAKHDMGEFHFSYNYSFFWDQLEKSNLFLQGIIDTKALPRDDQMVDWLFRNPINDGGIFSGVADILSKYGVVPAEVMPETFNSNNTRTMRSLIARKLRETAYHLREVPNEKNSAQELATIKTRAMQDIYRILVLCLGEPPTEFSWTLRDKAGKEISTEEYTPQSFFDRFVGQDLKADYVMVMNDPTRDYYVSYEIDFDRHRYDGTNWTYVNLPMDEIKAMAIQSIKDSTMMYMSCDVGKFSNRKNGIADLKNYDYASLFGMTFNMDKKQRIATYDSGSTHAMTLMAVDLDKSGKAKKWMVENSWGEASGYKGHIIMTDEWFDNYLFRLVVHTKYTPAKVKEIFKKTPVRLPAWDPLFAPEM